MRWSEVTFREAGGRGPQGLVASLLCNNEWVARPAELLAAANMVTCVEVCVCVSIENKASA